MSPRRSSRARTTQPTSAMVPHSNITSSNSSSRDRNRSILQADDRGLSASPNRSIDGESDINETTEHTVRLTRHTRRGPQPDRGTEAVDINMAEDDEGEEEEVTRCVCRHAEYPGPPIPLKDMATIGTEALAEDAGGLFIQCDVCKVWQHGGCVGIMDEAMSPDNYYCEQCRPDLHKVLTGAKGYVPQRTNSPIIFADLNLKGNDIPDTYLWLNQVSPRLLAGHLPRNEILKRDRLVRRKPSQHHRGNKTAAADTSASPITAVQLMKRSRCS